MAARDRRRSLALLAIFATPQPLPALDARSVEVSAPRVTPLVRPYSRASRVYSYSDLQAIGTILGVRVAVRPERQRIDSAVAEPTSKTPPAWRTLTIRKTPEELAAQQQFDVESSDRPQDRRFRPTLPPTHDRLWLTTSVGVVTGQDAALHLIGQGRVAGIQTNLTSLVTVGARGTEWYDGRLAVGAVDGPFSAEFGDIVSQTHGIGRGGSLSWDAVGRRRSTLAVYRPRFRNNGAVIAAYRDQMAVSRHLTLEGILASDSSSLTRIRIATRPFEIEQYFHRDRIERNLGGSASANVWRGLGLGGSARASRGSTPRELFRQAFVRLPLGGGVNLRLEHTWVTTPVSPSLTRAAEIVLPVGPMRIVTRWQDRNLVIGSQAFSSNITQRGLLTRAAYSPIARVQLSLQAGTEWLRDGRTQQYQELYVAGRLTRATSVQSTVAFADRALMDRLRLRVSHYIRDDLSLVAEVGRFSAFQTPLPSQEAFPSRLKLFVQKDWNVPTPAPGARVTGRVIDASGIGLPGIVVRLGQFRAATDALGVYTFLHVPGGAYDLAVDRETLPADFQESQGEQLVRVRAGQRYVEDLLVVRLGTIYGRVFVDRNSNGALEPGEGLRGAVLRLDASRLTQSRDDGSYVFSNVNPGRHTLELVIDRLSPYKTTSDAEILVQLPPGRAFVVPPVGVVEREKPVRLQPLGTSR